MNAGTKRLRLTAVSLALMVASAAMGQGSMAAQQPCPAGAAVTLPPAWAGWPAPVPLVAAADEAESAGAAVLPARAAMLRLMPTPRLAYPVRPDHPGDAGSFGGLVQLTVVRAGRYRIALGTAAWIEVARDGAAVASAAHDHGPACSGIHKIVDFDLVPGTYLIEIAAAPARSLELLVSPPG